MDSSRYLFRGKRIDNGEWEIGHYAPVIYEETWNGQDDHENITVKHVITNGFTQEVIQIETLGQSTGLRAAKSYRGESEADRLVWEGDIVESVSHKEFFSVDGKILEPLRRKCVVEYRRGQLLLVERYEQYGSGMETEWCMCTQGGNELEIIGNIHDQERPE